MAADSSLRQQVARRLLEIECIKFGDFKLKSGLQSPMYIDLRLLVTYPDLLKDIASLILAAVPRSDALRVCGVPYTALPIATAVSLASGLPMLMIRKEPKDYGTKKLVEGVFSPGDQSVLGVVDQLHAEGLVTKHIVVLVDRELGATERIASGGFSFTALFKLSELLDLVGDRVDAALLQSARRFIVDNQLPGGATAAEKPIVKLSYTERAMHAANPIAASLFWLMEQKKSNLCIAIDTVRSETLLQLCDLLGPHAAVIKTHVDMLNDWTPDTALHLQSTAARHNLLLFEDRKFADIGATVERQFFDGPFKIESWASLVTAHALPGPGIVASLRSPRVGVFLLAEMSSQGALLDPAYSQRVVDMAAAQPDVVAGLITKGSAPRPGPLFPSKQANCSGLVHATPGVQLAAGSGDSLGQQYNQTPQSAIANGSDLIIVGRGIVGPDLDTEPIPREQMLQAAQAYQQAAWNAYLERIAAP